MFFNTTLQSYFLSLVLYIPVLAVCLQICLPLLSYTDLLSLSLKLCFQAVPRDTTVIWKIYDPSLWECNKLPAGDDMPLSFSLSFYSHFLFPMTNVVHISALSACFPPGFAYLTLYLERLPLLMLLAPHPMEQKYLPNISPLLQAEHTCAATSVMLLLG